MKRFLLVFTLWTLFQGVHASTAAAFERAECYFEFDSNGGAVMRPTTDSVTVDIKGMSILVTVLPPSTAYRRKQQWLFMAERIWVDGDEVLIHDKDYGFLIHIQKHDVYFKMGNTHFTRPLEQVGVTKR